MEAGFARLMAAYNRMMNEQLYAACAMLPDAERRRDRGAFFHSIHGTLNHLLLTDRLWFGSFVGQPESFRALDDELYANFDELRAERGATDKRICDWAEELTTGDLGIPMQRGSTVMNAPLWVFVLHFFNHQTHHRGQVSAMLSQSGVEYGVTDLPWVPGVIDVLKD